MALRKLLIAGMGAGGAYLLLRAASAQTGQDQPQIILASAPGPSAPKPNKLQRLLPILNGVLDLADGAPIFGDNAPQPAQDAVQGVLEGFDLPDWVGGLFGGGDGSTRAPSESTGGANIAPLKAMIIKHESRGNYDAIWNGINRSDYPPRNPTQMTIGEVLDWQDSIDRKYNSEAVGAWQFLEDTLRGLVRQGHASKAERFSPAVQDRLAVALMDRRGLGRYRTGQMTDVQFAHNLSKEWASLPAQTVDKRGRRATGQSYYAGDGLNRALESKSAVLRAVRAI